MPSPVDFRFTVVPHTHWDREWYLPLEHFRLELARTIDEVLATLDGDERFRCFVLDGQAILLEDYLELRPEQEARVRAALAGGRLVAGPGYVLPDELLVGGEALVRNLLAGRAVCERFGAEPSRVGYLPDSFGHPQQLPQLLAGFGIGSFLFARGMGDEIDEVGHVFRWHAPDGSEVLAVNLPLHYGSAARLASAEDLAARTTLVAERCGEEYERAGLREIVLCNGSDHLPVQPELPDLLRACERLLPGASFAIGSFDDYVAAVEASRPQLPAWSGELVGSREHNLLRGVNSAHVEVKQANERAERQLLEAEAAAALVALAGGAAYPGSDFRFCWRRLLRNQPHDSICGCSVDEVHADMLERYRRLERSVSVLRRKAMAALAGQRLPLDQDEAPELLHGRPRASMLVLNPLPWRRRRLLVLELPAELRRAAGLEAELGGEPRPVQLAGRGAARRAYVAAELDGFEAAMLALRPASDGPHRGGEPRGRGQRAPRGRPAIASDRFRVEVARDGTLTVTDLRSGLVARRLHRLEDETDAGDLYDFCPLEGAPPWRSDARGVEVRARVVEEGPLFSELELALVASLPRGLTRSGRPSSGRVGCAIRTRVRLVAGGDRIELATEVDNRARDHRLRVVFPAPEAGDVVRAEGQFALLERPLLPARPRVRWRQPPAATQHTLGATALGRLALFSPGLPEIEARRSGSGAELALTLLRCVGLISRGEGELATRPHMAGPHTPTPGGQCPGRHGFRYAVRLDAQTLSAAELLRAAHDYRHDLLTGVAGEPPPVPLSVAGEVAFSCLKGAENGDGLVLRVFNPDARRTAGLRISGSLEVTRTTLSERGEETPVGHRISLRPGEIATLRLRHRA